MEITFMADTFVVLFQTPTCCEKRLMFLLRFLVTGFFVILVNSSIKTYSYMLNVYLFAHLSHTYFQFLWTVQQAANAYSWCNLNKKLQHNKHYKNKLFWENKVSDLSHIPSLQQFQRRWQLTSPLKNNVYWVRNLKI